VLKIIQITDCHLFCDLNKVGYNKINPAHSLEQILNEVSSEQPDKVIATGDISGDGSVQSYQHFNRLIEAAGLEHKLLVIPGNHDNQTAMQSIFCAQQLWSNTPHVILNNQWHLHLVDTQYQQTIGRLTQENLNALEQLLQQHRQNFHMIAAHHHPIPCGGWMDKHEWQNRQAFRSLVDQHPAVKAVIYGHIHMHVQQQQQQCLYMACPSTCWQFSNSEAFSFNDLQPGYRIINLAEDGQIHTSVQRLKKVI
jgi:Icc protein